MKFKFRTEISLSADRYPEISHQDEIALTGSCFSDIIGDKLNESKFKVLSNPFGISYNPVSISKQLLRISSRQNFTANEFFEKQELFYHFDLHSSMSGHDLTQLVSSVNTTLVHTYDFLRRCKILIMTLGTAWVYELKSEKKVVNNCHKFPAALFDKKLLESDEILSSLREALLELKKINPSMIILLTLSPVRHLRDGFEENSLSKALLRVAIERLVQESDCYYFPSYEVILDDLRDYRFYADDLLHPNHVAMKYIWHHFRDAMMSPETQRIIEKLEELSSAMKHRPFHQGSADHLNFLKAVKEKILQYMKDFKSINLEAELKAIDAQLTAK